MKVEVFIHRGVHREDDQVVKAGLDQTNEETGKRGSTYTAHGVDEEKAKRGKASAETKKEGKMSGMSN